MLTNNFYQIQMGAKGEYSQPNIANSTLDYEKSKQYYATIRNPNGKIYLTSTPMSGTEDTYIYVGNTNYNNSRPNFIIYNGDSSSPAPMVGSTSEYLDIPKDPSGITIPDNFPVKPIPIIFLGRGTTAEDVDDVSLVSYITTYDRNQVSASINGINNTITILMTFTPTADFSISELGVFCTTIKYSNLTAINRNVAMIARKVLTNPMQCTAGTQYTIEYIIDFKNGSDSVGTEATA